MEQKTSELSFLPGLSSDWYTSPAYFQEERKNIFQKEWIYLAQGDQIPEPGHYITMSVTNIPIILLRNPQGQLKGLYNICRHRGANVLKEKHGCLQHGTLVCRYHGWSYKDDGTLKNVPHMPLKNMTEEEMEKLFLPSFAVKEINGLIFGCLSLSGDAMAVDNCSPAFDQKEKELKKEFQAAGFSPEHYSYHSQIVRVGTFNWKVWIEGFQECYHCPTVHPIFNKDFHLSRYQVTNKMEYSLHTCPRREVSSSGGFEGLWLWIFPNCGLPCYEKIFYTLRINPLSVHETELIYTFMSRKDFSTEEAEKFFSFVKDITDEDIELCEQVQRNLETGLFPQGSLHPEKENGVFYFHELVKHKTQ
jgi:phenylpropionate dioxygenase-like ring-hydroxylating dioxygenase large terminal subunit